MKLGIRRLAVLAVILVIAAVVYRTFWLRAIDREWPYAARDWTPQANVEVMAGVCRGLMPDAVLDQWVVYPAATGKPGGRFAFDESDIATLADIAQRVGRLTTYADRAFRDIDLLEAYPRVPVRIRTERCATDVEHPTRNDVADAQAALLSAAREWSQLDSGDQARLYAVRRDPLVYTRITLPLNAAQTVEIHANTTTIADRNDHSMHTSADAYVFRNRGHALAWTVHVELFVRPCSDRSLGYQCRSINVGAVGSNGQYQISGDDEHAAVEGLLVRHTDFNTTRRRIYDGSQVLRFTGPRQGRGQP